LAEADLPLLAPCALNFAEAAAALAGMVSLTEKLPDGSAVTVAKVVLGAGVAEAELDGLTGPEAVARQLDGASCWAGRGIRGQSCEGLPIRVCAAEGG
jgi:hypothetical protein